MKRALIIEDNVLVSHVIEESLSRLGFHSFDHVWTEEGAVAAADRRRPDLIVVGEAIAGCWGINAARRICKRVDVPVLLVAPTGSGFGSMAPADARLDGPFPLEQLEQAITLGRQVAT